MPTSAFVHGGHDEYWDPLQGAEVDRALASGKVSLAHFGGNGAYWKTRAGPSSSGQPLRTLISYKSEAAQDPIPNDTARWRDSSVNHCYEFDKVISEYPASPPSSSIPASRG